MDKIQGKVWVFGDNIDTDMIMPGQYLKLNAEQASKYVMEGADPLFPKKLSKGDIIVGGRNFGCGSSRESAPAAIKLAGVGAVISVFFARIFFRNAINLGLPVVECPEAKRIEQGDHIEIDLKQGEIRNITKNETYKTIAYPSKITDILESGGLVNVLEKEVKNSRSEQVESTY